MSEDPEQDACQQRAVLPAHVSQCIDDIEIFLQDELGMDGKHMSESNESILNIKKYLYSIFFM